MVFSSNKNSVNLSKLSASAGVGGRNYPLDVMVVQRLLTGTLKKYTGWKELKPDGFYGGNTRKQIELFQKHIVCSKRQDGRVNVEGTSINCLCPLALHPVQDQGLFS